MLFKNFINIFSILTHSISSTAGVITVPSCYMVCLLKKACQKEGSTVLKGLKINRGHLNLRTVDNMLDL